MRSGRPQPAPAGKALLNDPALMAEFGHQIGLLFAQGPKRTVEFIVTEAIDRDNVIGTIRALRQFNAAVAPLPGAPH